MAVAAFCEYKHVHLALLQETRRTPSQPPPLIPSNWRWFESYAKDGIGGVAFLVSPLFRLKDPSFKEHVQGRLISATFGSDFVCFNVYAPTSFSGDNQNNFLRDLTKCIAETKENVPLMVGGDFNAAARIRPNHG